MKTPLTTTSPHGFTLREVIFGLAIMFVTVGLVVPVIASRGDFLEERDRSNAQQIAAFSDQATAHGAQAIAAGTVRATVALLATGIQNKSANRSTPYIKLAGFSAEELARAQKFLRLSKSGLTYCPIAAK
jgi:type II secretory pathway pseudopilin PulG